LAVLIYYFQARISLIGLEKPQRKQMAIMGLISPIMIGIISLNVPAALPLYWAVSGLYMIVQTLVIKRYIHGKKAVPVNLKKYSVKCIPNHIYKYDWGFSSVNAGAFVQQFSSIIGPNCVIKYPKEIDVLEFKNVF